MPYALRLSLEDLATLQTDKPSVIVRALAKKTGGIELVLILVGCVVLAHAVYASLLEKAFRIKGAPTVRYH